MQLHLLGQYLAAKRKKLAKQHKAFQVLVCPREEQLRYFKQLHEYQILNEKEYIEQKKNILLSLYTQVILYVLVHV